MNELEQLRALRDACVERLAEINHDLIGRDELQLEAVMLKAEKLYIERLLTKAGLLPEKK